MGINIFDMGDEGFYIKQIFFHAGAGQALGIPMSTRDVADIPEEPSHTLFEVKAAQKVAGELLWISTRIRLDIVWCVTTTLFMC